MLQTTISNAKVIVKKMVEHKLNEIKAGNYSSSPIYLHSSPGLGKSAVTKAISKELDLGFVDLRLGSCEAADVCGIPFVANQGSGEEEMKLSVPDWFPTEEKIKAGKCPEFGILFFDELSNAPIGVQHAAYRIILDREVQNGVRLPDGWQIIAAGNLKSDKTGAKGVAPALANRFATHLEIVPSLDDFRAYAVNAGMNHQVLGFLSFKQDALYKFDPSKSGSDVAFASPRSWEQVSRILEVGYTDDELQLVLAGAVGKGVSTAFMTFRKYYGKLPDFDKIMDGTEEYTIPKNDAGIVFAVTSSIISCLSANADGSPKSVSRIKNIEKLMKQLEPDFLVLIYKTIKDGFGDQAISSILMNTVETYKSIVKYVK